jgi:hypothetical protein
MPVAKSYILKKVPLWPVIRISFVLFIILGIIVGIFYALLLSISGIFATALTGGLGELGFIRGLGFVLVPIVAIFYAVFGTIVVAIWALIYNLLASILGGIELTLEPAERPTPQAAPRAPSIGGPEPPRPSGPAGPEGSSGPEATGGKTIEGF